MRGDKESEQMRWRARMAVPTLWAGLMLTTAGAFAQDAPDDPPDVIAAANAPAIYRQLERRIRIESDGRYTETAVVRVTIQQQAAVQALGQLAFSYQAEHDTFALRKLVVEKRDGSRVDVDIAHLEDAPTPQSGSFDAPVYNDTRAKQITVPSLAAGDTIAYETEITRHTPFLAGHFWDEHTFQDGQVDGLRPVAPVERTLALLQQAVKANSGHRQAWTWLGSALLGAGRSKEAIDAYNRHVAIDPFSEYAYRNRALAEWGAGQLSEAEASLRKQLDVTPLNGQALVSLGSLLIERKRPAEAIEPLKKAVSLDGKDAWSELTLGRAYAGAGKSDDSLAAFERTVTIAPNPLMWNNAAWYMAEHDLAFDRAFEYAQSATTAAAASTLLLSLDKPAGPQLSLTSSLAAYWDTLGWVEFKRGNVESALGYLQASWQVREEAIVGEHLGRVLERLQRPREAFVVYRTALGLPAPSDWLRDRTRELGLSLKPAITTDSATLLTQKRTVVLPKTVVPVRAAQVMLVANAKGVITGARPVSATEASTAAAQSLVGTRLPINAPDAVPFRLVVRAALSCVDGKPPCSLFLFGINDALQRSSSDTRVE
jgi:tetratricopeptide (TPR) repeat protein